VLTLRASFLTEIWGQRRLGAIVLIAFIALGCGSGSSGTDVPGSTGKSSVKEEDLYKYVGEGAAKKKVSLTRRERQKVRREKSQGSD
jgi:hypothetical protein